MKRKGFTLIELVVTIAVVGILSTFVTAFMSRPIEAYILVSDRAVLAGVMATALQKISQDVSKALPHSVRVSADARALEFYNVVLGARYRAAGPPEDATYYVDFSQLQEKFRILGNFPSSYIGDHPDWRIVIFNTGQYDANDFDQPVAGMNVYSSSRVGPGGNGQAPANTHVRSDPGFSLNSDGTSEDEISLFVPTQFAVDSPNKRVYVVNTPVTYLCDLDEKTLTKYWEYAPTDSQPKTAIELSWTKSALLAQGVTDCRFAVRTSGDGQFSNVTIFLQLSSPTMEKANLIQEVVINNVP